MRQAREAGAEIVDRDAHARARAACASTSAAPSTSRTMLVSVISNCSHAGSQPVRCSVRLQVGDHRGVAQLAGGEVHAHHDVAQPARRATRAPGGRPPRAPSGRPRGPRPDSSASGMKPAGSTRPCSGSCQRSSASARAHRAAGDVHDRLEVQRAARRSCSARRSAVSISMRRCARRCPSSGGEGAEAVAAELLRVVHRGVGVLQQRLGIVAILRDRARGRGCRSRGSRGPRPGTGGAPRRGSCARRGRAPRRRAGPPAPPRTRRRRCARAGRSGAARARMRRESSFSSTSPTRWPSVSFTSLKWSRSRNMTADAVPRRAARARARPRGGRSAARCWAAP